MTAQDLPGQLAARPETVVMDARSAFEFRRGHVPGAVHLPFWAAACRPLQTAGPSTPIVVYCGHGPRARIARALLRWRGAKDVCLLDGHMAAWRRAGRPEQTGP